ncbi:MAG: ABC transporter ATP-binding protein [Spirochaetaceae bacterium]|nr:ABC transporter ATP-binding protein [Spirochaetaceae bacterium]
MSDHSSPRADGNRGRRGSAPSRGGTPAGANGSDPGAGVTARAGAGVGAGGMPPGGASGGGWSNGSGSPRGRRLVRRPALRALLRTLMFMRHYKAATLASLICLLASSAGNLAVPRITQLVVDSGILEDRLQAIVIGSVVIFAVTVLRSLFTYLQGVLAAKVSQGVAYDLRNALYDHIQSLSFSYHDRSQTGQLLTRATSDVDMVRTFISTGVIQIVTTVVLMIGSLYLLFVTNWRLALHVVPVMLAVFALFSFMARKGRPIFRGIQEKIAALNTRLEENLVGVRVVKAYTGAAREQRRFEHSNQELYDQSMLAAAVFSLAIPLVFAMSNFGTLVVTWGGGIQILAQRLTIGELVAFQGYLIVAMFPITMLGMIMMSISQASASAERIFEILDAESDVKEVPGAAQLAPLTRGVRFEGVGFRYFGLGAPVLQDVTFATRATETIAIVGGTGSGKSTIINLIPRFYDVTEGRITFDGVDIRDVTLESLRRQIGIVLEETTLFGGTIRENIAYGRPEATDEQIAAAAQAAAAHDFIESFPNGYHSEVGERGVTLSGGQKQRIAIARALLIEPRILIFDDSTSNVDYETEVRIRAAIDRLKRDRLSFVIASRMNTVLAADRVVLLHQGRIAGLGTHRELLDNNALYAETFYAQLSEQEDPVRRPKTEEVTR